MLIPKRQERVPLGGEEHWGDVGIIIHQSDLALNSKTSQNDL